MKALVISDTHAKSIDGIPPEIISIMKEVDLIIHAGDITEKPTLDALMAIGEVKAVYGNMDSGEIKRLLPQEDIFTLNGIKIGLVHGSGAPWGIADRVWKLFEDVDIIIYGHSHEAHNKYLNNTLMLNPGTGKQSYGLLEIGDSVKSEIFKI